MPWHKVSCPGNTERNRATRPGAAQARRPRTLCKLLSLSTLPWQRELLRSTAMRLALLCPRQSGKSTTTAIVALHHAIYHCDAVVLVLSPSQRQSDLLFEKIIDGFETMPEKPAGAHAIAGRLELPNGSRIISLPGNEKTIRGLSADLIVVDEAAQVSDALFNTALPMVIARSGRIGDSTQYFDSELIAAAFDPRIEPFYEVTGHAY